MSIQSQTCVKFISMDDSRLFVYMEQNLWIFKSHKRQKIIELFGSRSYMWCCLDIWEIHWLWTSRICSRNSEKCFQDRMWRFLPQWEQVQWYKYSLNIFFKYFPCVAGSRAGRRPTTTWLGCVTWASRTGSPSPSPSSPGRDQTIWRTSASLVSLVEISHLRHEVNTLLSLSLSSSRSGPRSGDEWLRFTQPESLVPRQGSDYLENQCESRQSCRDFSPQTRGQYLNIVKPKSKSKWQILQQQPPIWLYDNRLWGHFTSMWPVRTGHIGGCCCRICQKSQSPNPKSQGFGLWLTIKFWDNKSESILFWSPLFLLIQILSLTLLKSWSSSYYFQASGLVQGQMSFSFSI